MDNEEVEWSGDYKYVVLDRDSMGNKGKKYHDIIINEFNGNDKLERGVWLKWSDITKAKGVKQFMFNIYRDNDKKKNDNNGLVIKKDGSKYFVKYN